MCVRVPFFLAHRPKDPRPNTYCLVDWAWFTATKWTIYKPSGAQSKDPTTHIHWQARIYVLNSKKIAKGKQCNKEKHTITVRDPQVNMKYLIIFLIMDYNVLTKTCYKVHISSKITDLDGYSSLKDLQSLNIFESEYILVRTSFDLDPTQEWIQAHVAQTMNL